MQPLYAAVVHGCRTRRQQEVTQRSARRTSQRAARPPERLLLEQLVVVELIEAEVGPVVGANVGAFFRKTLFWSVYC